MNKKIPSNYFDQFSDKLMQRIEHLEDEVESTAPTLHSMGKRNGYSVPEEYFGKNAGVIMSKLPRKRRFLGLTMVVISAVAACLVLMISIIGVGSDGTTQTEELQLAEVIEYLETDQIDDTIIEDFLAEELAEEMDDLTDGIPEEELDLYLNEFIDEFTDEELSDLL